MKEQDRLDINLDKYNVENDLRMDSELGTFFEKFNF